MKTIIYSNMYQPFEDQFGMTLEQYNKDHETDYTEEWEVTNFHEELEWEDFSRIHNMKAFTNLLVIADMGLWNGRRKGYKECSNLNVTGGGYDYVEYKVERGNLRVTGAHHDGTNFMLVRRWKDDISDEARENYMEHLYSGTDTQSMLYYYTESIGKEVIEAMGWA